METIVDDRETLNDFLEEADLQQYFELFRDILKVNKLSQLKFVALEDLSQIGLSKPEQRRYKKIYSKYFPNPYISKIKKLLSSHKKNDNGHSTIPVEMDLQPFSENNVKVPTKHIISIEDITINKELGMGQFGVVQQGTWTTGNQRLQVAIKCLGHERMTSNSTEFLKEAAVMHSIEHPSIVRLYGVVLHMDSLMLVTELAPLRSLLECLREVALRPNFPVPNLCEFAEQICDGMTYLEIKRLIHRDLAARNILVFSKDRVKISDFGLSRALGVGKDYYQTNYNVNLKLPVAWCAPECILFLRFTSASDVWAFGVCLWELFTYGFQPWAAFSGQQILEAIDAPHFQRLERPECCPEAHYALMRECWAHEPNDRPKFRDVGTKLRAIRPQQVQATSNFQKPEEGRRNNFLEYKNGQIITVLGKESMTNAALWYGVVAGGACGMFDPTHTKPYTPDRGGQLQRADGKRHSYAAPRARARAAPRASPRARPRAHISAPQGDLKHTGHVGLDGAYFGDISFLDPAGCPPRQVVTPYKPSEDLEQVPLINPNSPSHLSAAAAAPYPLLAPAPPSAAHDLRGESRSKSLRRNNHRTSSESTAGRSILNKVRSATLGRAPKGDAAAPRASEVHEYQEITDTDQENSGHPKPEYTQRQTSRAENVDTPSGSTEFSQSLLDEMESMFRNYETRRRDDPSSQSRPVDTITGSRPHTLSKADKRKAAGSMKPMSAHDARTLDTAVALANEITSKSMTDLGGSPGARARPPRFKFPLALHAPPPDAHAAPDRDALAGKQERRNFSEEANSVPDIQSTLTAESKHAYTSLIEEPTPPGWLMSQLAHDARHHTAPVAKPPRQHHAHPPAHTDSLPPATASDTHHDETEHFPDLAENALPLPPRTSKPKLVDKPRHIRKHPLRLSAEPPRAAHNIYQNTRAPPAHAHDAPHNTATGMHTNPFRSAPRASPEAGPSAANPFDCFFDDDSDDDVAAVLLKDCQEHVSVEDLLEFADHKPCGRQRGAESDEARVMRKVLKQQVSAEQCVAALELCEWDVHRALKLLRDRLRHAP